MSESEQQVNARVFQMIGAQAVQLIEKDVLIAQLQARIKELEEKE